MRELVKLIRNLKAADLTGVAVMANFATRRLQPLKERSHPANLRVSI